MKKKLIALVSVGLLALATFALTGASPAPVQAHSGGACCGSCATGK